MAREYTFTKLPQDQRRARKLTDEQVLAIRASTQTNMALAEAFDVSYMTIWKIREGLSYRHVTTSTPLPPEAQP